MNEKQNNFLANNNLSRREFLNLIGFTVSAGLTSFFLSNQRIPKPEIWTTEKSTTKKSRSSNTIEPDIKQVDPGLSPVEQPNIIFILGDNHNSKTMSCAGHPFIQTPGLDRLASEGLIFKNTFCTTPLCSPSRASILTGSYAHNHGVKNNHTAWTGKMTTFLEYLSNAGYSTAFIGKWHMPGGDLPELSFLDLFVSYTFREGQGAYFNCPMIVNGEEIASRRPYITDEITDYALEFIRENLAIQKESRKPFCIYLSHRAGHPPYQAPGDMKGMYDNADVENVLPDRIDPWWYGKANRNMFQGVMNGSYYDQYRHYCETLTAMDKSIARLLEELDRSGLMKNTVVVYVGDNGMQWGTHNCHGIREPYDESIRLPFVVRSPSMIPDPGSHRTQLALNIDIAPTLLDIVGLPIPKDMDGQSLVPVLTTPDIESRKAFLLEYWRYFPENTPSYQGVRTDRYKYIEYERGRDPLLFDLKKDPTEMINLFNNSTSSELIETLKGIQERFAEGLSPNAP
jgi:N-acetylglucosamine-6-sulfatase